MKYSSERSTWCPHLSGPPNFGRAAPTITKIHAIIRAIIRNTTTVLLKYIDVELVLFSNQLYKPDYSFQCLLSFPFHYSRLFLLLSLSLQIGHRLYCQNIYVIIVLFS